MVSLIAQVVTNISNHIKHVCTTRSLFMIALKTCVINMITKLHCRIHKQSKHEYITYNCNQCYFKIAIRQALIRHQQSKHKGVNYSCYQCDFKATLQSTLIKHRQSKHEGVTYSCVREGSKN